MRFPPPEVIASWPKPNYKDPENRGPALLIVELTALPLAIICVALRLYVRIHVIKRSGWDDWLMVAAVFFCSGVTVSVILGRFFDPRHPVGSENADHRPMSSDSVVWLEHPCLGLDL